LPSFADCVGFSPLQSTTGKGVGLFKHPLRDEEVSGDFSPKGKELNKINCTFELAEIPSIQAFLNFEIYNLFCTGTYLHLSID